MRILFWTALAWVVYAYVGYGVMLRVLASLRTKPVRRGDVYPRVSVILAVHNGALTVRERLENILEQSYAPERIEIIVADDGSDDGTDRIVREQFAARGVRLVRLEQRGGKESAQKAALAATSGEVVVFTDVGTRFDRHGIEKIVRSFADPTVGAVSSEDRLLDSSGAAKAGEGGYVGYEMRLRRLESRVGSLVGLSGSFFAARREVCEGFSDRLASDFRTALRAVGLGLRAVNDHEAIGYYRDAGGETREFDRKVRTVVRGMTVLFSECRLLNPLRYGLFSWQLASHKLARWTVPLAMIVALGASAVLARGSEFFRVALAAQVASYLVGFAVPLGPLRKLRYLVEVNLAILVAWSLYLRGDRIVTWTPTTR
jgi:glycosyltransferase involved in cell wall biosynthesis